MSRLAKPPRVLVRAAARAIVDYDMLRDGDRVLVGVSGGKDSLSLLHVLLHLKSYAPVKFELAALTIDPEVDGFDPSRLEAHYDELGVRWHYAREPILEDAKTRLDGDSFCAYCSRMKRGIMYTTCRREGYGVLALGHHLDDLAETFLMSAFHSGRLDTMRAHYQNKAGDLRIIRPFIYVREAETRAFAAEAGLPVVMDSCPACFRAPTERAHMKELLAREAESHPHVHANLLRAMRPLMGARLHVSARSRALPPGLGKSSVAPTELPSE
ncbi:MAG: hypothetical protein OZ921_04180 [Sorangiineae bacterium]|nr:hypothetical protein [Polyangiaceae bacterium]MEB2321687.1 hypothetical protein [Sorangiineae bacterium]